MITVAKVLLEGEVVVRPPFQGILVPELKNILLMKNLRLGGSRADIVLRLIAAGVQDPRTR